jgi:cobalt-precorrin-5B (C1)-methyltransferase
MSQKDGSLRIPSLPRSARRARKTLRRGWTTGACAAAAAKAAAIALQSGAFPEAVDIPLPRGGRAVFSVAEGWLSENEATAVVIKDAGDDPDVTHGARITVTLSPRQEPGLAYRAGPGVGVVTLPGLGLEVGEPAINPVPRQMIAAAIGEVVSLDSSGFLVTVAVPGGEEMAAKTSNPRLGIVGGISILGTTGIVKPFSTAAWRASVAQAVDIAAARNLDTVVLATGSRTDRAAQRYFSHLDPGCFIEVGDFTGFAIRRAAKKGLETVVLVAMPGKLAKLASGIGMTHWTRSQVPLEVFVEAVREVGGPSDLAEQVSRAKTARHAFEILSSAGFEELLDDLCRRAEAHFAEYAPGPRYGVVAVDPDGERIVGAGPNGKKLEAGRGSVRLGSIEDLLTSSRSDAG